MQDFKGLQRSGPFLRVPPKMLPKEEGAEARLRRSIDRPGSLGLFCPLRGSMYSDAATAAGVADPWPAISQII